MGAHLSSINQQQLHRHPRRGRSFSEDVRSRITAACRAVPKVELHAHVNGSIPRATLQAMYLERATEFSLDPPAVRERRAGNFEALGMESDALLAMNNPKERMMYSFRGFDAVYSVVDSISALERGLQATLESYAAEGTLYLELRTSLRQLRGESREAYLRAVMRVLNQWDETHVGESGQPSMMVKLLVSINRGHPPEVAAESVALAVKLRDEELELACPADRVCGPRIVGIDFSGNAYKNCFADFLDSLDEARAAGLKVTLHVGEKDDDAELEQMLRWKPDRIGHLVFAGADNQQLVSEQRVPLELCITSNLMTTNWVVADHHVVDWHRNGHPVSINTDDRGVFKTTMSRELALFAEALLIGSEEEAREAAAANLRAPVIAMTADECASAVFSVTRAAITQGFCTPDEKAMLLDKYDRLVAVAGLEPELDLSTGGSTCKSRPDQPLSALCVSKL